MVLEGREHSDQMPKLGTPERLVVQRACGEVLSVLPLEIPEQDPVNGRVDELEDAGFHLGERQRSCTAASPASAACSRCRTVTAATHRVTARITAVRVVPAARVGTAWPAAAKARAQRRPLPSLSADGCRTCRQVVVGAATAGCSAQPATPAGRMAARGCAVATLACRQVVVGTGTTWVRIAAAWSVSASFGRAQEAAWGWPSRGDAAVPASPSVTCVAAMAVETCPRKRQARVAAPGARAWGCCPHNRARPSVRDVNHLHLERRRKKKGEELHCARLVNRLCTAATVGMIDHYALSYCGSYNPQSSESHLAPVVHDVFSPRCHHIRGVHRFEAILLELVVTAVAVVVHRQCCAHRDLGADEEDGVLGLGLARAVGGLVTEVDAAAERAVAERVVCVCGVSGEGVGVRRREAWRVRKTRRASKLEYESDVPATLHSAGLNDSVLAPVTCEVVQRHRVELGRVTVFVRVAGHGGVKCGCVVEEVLCALRKSCV